MEDTSIHLPSESNEESQTKMPTLKSSRRTNKPSDATRTPPSVTRASQGKGAILDFGEFNLPPRPTPDVIDIPDSDDDDDSHIEHTDGKEYNFSSDDDEEEDDEDTPSGPRLGALPPMFYRLNPPTRPTTEQGKIPIAQVKAEAATHPIAERQIVHVYLLSVIHIKADMPDWPGLMKIYDFLHYKVGSNATILVLPSKRRGGDENPIITRWNKSTNRSIFPIYFQGYTIPKTPLSATAEKKANTAAKNKTDSAIAKAGRILKVRVCVSLQVFQLTALEKAIKVNTDPQFHVDLDSLRSEFIERVGWITGSHKAMNRTHWAHFIKAQLTHLVGACYELRLEIEALSPPKGASGNEKFRQYNPKKGTDPIQMWAVYTGKPSSNGLCSSLHSLFHTTWQDKLFGQDMQFLPTSTADSPDGKATMWQAAKAWQDTTVVVKSFGLCHIHDRIVLPTIPGLPEPNSHSLAYYCRQVHQPGGPPLFRAIEETDVPTASDLLIHGHGPVVSFLVHKDDQRVAEMFAADVFNTLAYTNPRLQKAHVYRLGESYVPLAATQAVAEAEAAEALAALTLRVTGYAKDTTPYILDMPGTVSRATPKTTAPNPLDTSMTPPRSTKKQRVTGNAKHDYDFSTAESTAAVSSLTASESQRLIDLETQVKSLQEGAAPLATQDMGEMLKRVLTAMFPNQAAYTAAIFQNYGYSPDEPISPPRSPSQLTSPGTSYTMMDTDNPSIDEYHPTKQAEVDDDE